MKMFCGILSKMIVVGYVLWPGRGRWKLFMGNVVFISDSSNMEVAGGETGIGEGEACNRDILPLCTSYSSRTTTTVSTINHNRCRTKSEEVTM
jgi:hypothetical protein